MTNSTGTVEVEMRGKGSPVEYVPLASDMGDSDQQLVDPGYSFNWFLFSLSPALFSHSHHLQPTSTVTLFSINPGINGVAYSPAVLAFRNYLSFKTPLLQPTP